MRFTTEIEQKYFARGVCPFCKKTPDGYALEETTNLIAVMNLSCCGVRVYAPDPRHFGWPPQLPSMIQLEDSEPAIIGEGSTTR